MEMTSSRFVCDQGASLADRIPYEKKVEGAHKGGEVQHQKAMERHGEST
jgi:hypothetical protein